MSEEIHFEQSIQQLEHIVRQLEKGELTLEESLKQFEDGIGLARHCQEILKQAEQKIKTLTTVELNRDSSLDEECSD